MKYIEVFKSYQGEGPWMGRICWFIRLAGCSKRCPFCDQKEAWKGGKKAKPIELVQMITDQTPYVVITGGEPTEQNLTGLLTLLKKRGYKVQLETNGEKFIEEESLRNDLWAYIDWFDCIVVSPKRDDLDSFYPLFRQDNVYFKFLVKSPDDIYKIFENVSFTQLYKKPAYIQPLDGDPEIAKAILEEDFPPCITKRIILSPQLHKLLGVK